MSRHLETNVTVEEGTTAVVPKLRFPEFREAGGWDADGLGKVADFVNEKVPVEGVALESYVSTENMLPDYSGIARASKLPTTGSATRYRPNDNLVSNIRPYLRKVWVADKDGGASNDVIVIRAKQRLLPQYLSCLLKNDAFIDYVMTGAKGVKMPRGDIGSMKEYPTLYPSLAEQQKIAECLSSVDDLLAAQARKVDALKTHKKGLMQQLFPREGETQPRLRFPEFQNTGEWEVLTVSQFAKVTTGAKDTQNKVEGGKYPFFVRSQTVERIDSFSYDGEAVLTSGDGVGVGKNFHHINGKFDFHQRVYCIYDFDKSVGGLFFYLYFSEHFGERVMRMSAKNSVDSVRMAMITEMPVMVPTLPEQQSIAECLSSLDALITAETRKHEALKTHKKGLMQQLFPTPEEPT
jgi:type I restriction enzyme S subunit